MPPLLRDRPWKISYASNENNPVAEFYIPALECAVQESELFPQLAELHRHPGCLDFCLKSIPIKPWPHQLKILRSVAQQFPHNFLIADEVRLGKTIVTRLILRSH